VDIDRPPPRHRIRQIAEALADMKTVRVKMENDGAPTIARSGAACHRGGAADREDELVLGIGIELILGADDEIVEASARAPFACSRMWKVSVNVNRPVLGDELL